MSILVGATSSKQVFLAAEGSSSAALGRAGAAACLKQMQRVKLNREVAGKRIEWLP